jgi:hypothetical protein
VGMEDLEEQSVSWNRGTLLNSKTLPGVPSPLRKELLPQAQQGLNPSYLGGQGVWIVVRGPPRQKPQKLSEKSN